MRILPSGTVTFLFTDIEGSTKLAQEHPDKIPSLLKRHNEILNQSIERHEGFIFQIVGDSFSAAFHNARDAVTAALEAQCLLLKEVWSPAPVKVRMGIHTGAAQLQEEASGFQYSGYATIALAQRVMSAGHGGQILISKAVFDLLADNLPEETQFKDMGEHHLKDVLRKQQLFQLVAPELPLNFPPLRSQNVIRHNLPAQLTSFIGRQSELAQIKNLLTQTRLLTLLGPGGTGKTRLALQAAEKSIDEFLDGVWLVELAPLSDPTLIPERVAAALNVQEQGKRPILDTLTTYLRRKKILLVLDNVEHLVNESAQLVEHLLLICPDLKVLVTGREALFISGETTLQVPSLSLPIKEVFAPQDIADSEAVQLFQVRARDVRPDFALTPENAPALADVVRRLDGNPLALELAAVRLRMLSVEQINERLNDRFRLLRTGHRNELPRQQTLQAMIDWSWQLLNENEQILLRRLSVFSGGWNLESAQAIAAFEPLDEFNDLDELEQLINKSLVTVKYSTGGKTRYHLQESIRQFAHDKLLETSENQTLQDRFLNYFVSFSQEAGSHLRLSTMVVWEKRIVEELDNIRSAFSWALDEHPELALRISAALLTDWAQWIHPSEALAWLQSSIEKTRALLNVNNSPIRMEDFIKALYALGFTEALLGQVELSRTIAEEGIQLAYDNGELQLYTFGVAQKFSSLVQHWAEISDEWLHIVEKAIAICENNGFEVEMARLHLVMYGFLLMREDLERAKEHFQKADVIIQKYQNPLMLGFHLIVKAEFAKAQGDLETAVELYEQAADAFSAINYQRILLIVKSSIAHIFRRSGNIEEAIPYYQDTIVKWQEQGNPIAIAHQLECFAFIGIAFGKFEQSAQLLGRAKATRVELNAVSKDPQEMAELDQAMTQITESLGIEERDNWIKEGTKIKIDDAVSLALSSEVLLTQS